VLLEKGDEIGRPGVTGNAGESTRSLILSAASTGSTATARLTNPVISNVERRIRVPMEDLPGRAPWVEWG
jgi:hypothetical protein